MIVAVSGGSDSICLLTVLSRLCLDLKLRAVYIDHGLRPQEIPQEITLIEKLCTVLGITFTVRKVDVYQLAKEKKMSIEEAARHLRYQALEKERRCRSFQKIAVGHNADDQVEEFFIRLFRGSGSTGLAGMQAKHNTIIRPLLFETKQSIEKYLRDRGISWATDSSNFQLDFLRNKIRHQLLPELEQTYNPGIRSTVQHTMEVLQGEDNFLATFSLAQYSCCVDEILKKTDHAQLFSISLDSGKYLSNHVAVRRRIVEKICWKMRSQPSFVIINDIDQLVQTAETGKELHLKNGLRVQKKLNAVFFSHPLLEENKRGSQKRTEPYEMAVNGTGLYHIPGTTVTVELTQGIKSANPKPGFSELMIDFDKVVFPLTLRGARPGERFTPYRGVGSKKVSRYFNDQKLEKQKRSSWPVLFSDKSLVAVVGYTIAHQFRVTTNTVRILRISYSTKSENYNN